MEQKHFDVIGMTCASCQANVTKAVSKIPGVDAVDVSLLSNSMKVDFDPAKTNPEQIEEAVSNIGYEAKLKGAKLDESGTNSIQAEWDARKKRMEAEQKERKQALVYSLILLVPLMIIAMGPMMGIFPFLMDMKYAMASTIVQLILTMFILFFQRSFFIHGLKALFKKAPNMDSLVAIGGGAAFVYGVYGMLMMAIGYGSMDHELIHQAMHSLYFESAATIVTLVSLGKYLEARSKSKTSDALGKLVDLAPKSATILKDGQEIQVATDQIVSGDTVVIRPGQRIPVDGIVKEGVGYVDQAAITGESVPVEKMEGDPVISATMNINGTFQFTATKVGADTTLAQIIQLVDEAGNSKAPIARLADKVSGIFVPIVIGIAVVTAVVWLMAGAGFEFALSNAIAVLVISCPCALGLATPVAIMVSTGKAAEYGILVKSAESLENLHNINAIVLDKTGTITSGKPSVQTITTYGDAYSPKDFLQLAAQLEMGSEHPLGKAIVEKAKEDGLQLTAPESFEAIGGRGLKATLHKDQYLAGNLKLMEEQNIPLSNNQKAHLDELAEMGQTPLIFAENGKVIGMVSVADTIRQTSALAIEKLKEKGIYVVMLTGDNEKTAKAIANKLHVDEVIADVLPTQKESVIRRLQEEGRNVAMVGDGINDAPALARANIGIAIGAGTDIAIDSADIVLMKSNLMDVNTAIDLSNATIKNIKQNLFWAFFYNVLGIPVAAGLFYPIFGWTLNPMLGSAAMSLSSVCVVTNALRLRFFKPKGETPEEIKEQEVNKQEVQIFQEKEERIHNNALDPQEYTEVVKVENMSCQRCKNKIENALMDLDGVIYVDVNLDSKEVKIDSTKPVAQKEIFDVIESLGYTPSKIEAQVQEPLIQFMNVEGMSCAHCENRVEKAIGAVEGVEKVKADAVSGKVEITANKPIEQKDLDEAVIQAGYTPAPAKKEDTNIMEKEMKVNGMSCAHCKAHVEDAISKVDGVTLVNVDLPSGIAHIQTSKPVDDSLLIKAVEEAGYEPKEITEK